jgi:hypothetical protein
MDKAEYTRCGEPNYDCGVHRCAMQHNDEKEH